MGDHGKHGGNISMTFQLNNIYYRNINVRSYIIAHRVPTQSGKVWKKIVIFQSGKIFFFGQLIRKRKMIL